MLKFNYLIESDFWDDLNNQKLDIIKPIALDIIEAIKSSSKKKKIKIFEVYIADEYIIDFSIYKDEYYNILNNTLPKFVEYEEYELCEQIKQILNDSKS